VGALVTAVLFGWVGPVAAAPAIEDLVVAPPGVRVVRAPDSEEEPPRTDSFLDSYDDLDAQTVDTDVALLRVGDVGSTSVVVTIVRLASPAQARRAFDAVHAPQPSVAWSEGPVEGVGTRWVDDGQYQLLERYRTVGSDLVVWAEMLPEERTGSSLLERAVEAHLAAYPPDHGGVPLVWIAAVPFRPSRGYPFLNPI